MDIAAKKAVKLRFYIIFVQPICAFSGLIKNTTEVTFVNGKRKFWIGKTLFVLLNNSKKFKFVPNEPFFARAI
jgi:hypothetical protein